MYQLVQSVLKIGFAKSGIRGGGWVLARGAMHMAAALAGYRTTLAGPFLTFLTHTGSGIHSFTPFLDL